jgi:hypothetical protein
MTNHRRYKPKRPLRKPADAAAGAHYVRKFMLKLFDREDGRAADWPLIADTLLREALHTLDQCLDDPRATPLLQQIHSESYDRLTTARSVLNRAESDAQAEHSRAADPKSQRPAPLEEEIRRR